MNLSRLPYGRKVFFYILFALAFVCFFIYPLNEGRAHVMLLGTIQGEIKANIIQFQFLVPRLSEYERNHFKSGISETLAFFNNGAPCNFNQQSISNLSTFGFVVDVVCRDRIGLLTMKIQQTRNQSPELVVNIRQGEQTFSAIYNGDSDDKQFDFRSLEHKPISTTSFYDFVLLGIKHIYTGLDHVLFVLVLILTSSSIWLLVKTVTAFTVAHSITLLLSTLNLVRVSQKVVEPAIALSIAYVALVPIFHEYFRKNMSGSIRVDRWAVVFIFGLFHGLGFSTILKDIGIPKTNMVPSLLFFNIGIELAQLSIILAVFPIVVFFKKFAWERMAVTTLLGGLGLLGLWWFFDRLK